MLCTDRLLFYTANAKYQQSDWPQGSLFSTNLLQLATNSDILHFVERRASTSVLATAALLLAAQIGTSDTRAQNGIFRV